MQNLRAQADIRVAGTRLAARANESNQDKLAQAKPVIKKHTYQQIVRHMLRRCARRDLMLRRS